MLQDVSLQALVRKELSSTDLQLPVFNPIALEIQRAANDPRSDVADIKAAIAKDPALASQVLRVANAPFFAGMNRADTIDRAIVRLGMKQVASIAFLASQKGSYASVVPLVREHMEALWRMAVASAVGGRWVATQCGYAGKADTAFLAGLLHDIGKLLLLKTFETLFASKAGGLALEPEVVTEVLENMHAEQGARLLEQWNLPNVYRLVAQDHHNSITETADQLLVIVRLVDQVVSKLGIGGEPEPSLMPEASPEALALGLNDIKLAELEIMLEDSVALGALI